MKLFAELSGKHKAIEITRWICVLPAAYIASQSPYIALALFRPPAVVQQAGFTPAGPPAEYRRLIHTLIILPLSAAAFVVAGSLVAPRFRGYMAIALAVLFALLALLSHVILRLPGTPNYDHFAAAAVAALVSGWGVSYFNRSARTGRAV